jgi:hypothetical protein
MVLGANYPGKDHVDEGEVPLRMKYRQLLAVARALALQAG